MDDHKKALERLIMMKSAKRREELAQEVNIEQGMRIAKFAAQGVLHSSGTVSVIVELGCKELDGSVRAEYEAFKEVNESAGLLTPDGLRERGKTYAVNFRSDAIRRRLARGPVAMSVYEPAYQDKLISDDVNKLRARFLRDVEIDATELESALVKTRTSHTKTIEEYFCDVFISFGTPDIGTAEFARRLLTAEGLKAFFSPKELVGGDAWEERVRIALIGAREVCLIVSKVCLNREWVLTEWGAAWATKKRITPVLVDCQVHELPPRLQSRQCITIEDLPSYAKQAAMRAGAKQ